MEVRGLGGRLWQGLAITVACRQVANSPCFQVATLMSVDVYVQRASWQHVLKLPTRSPLANSQTCHATICAPRDCQVGVRACGQNSQGCHAIHPPCGVGAGSPVRCGEGGGRNLHGAMQSIRPAAWEPVARCVVGREGGCMAQCNPSAGPSSPQGTRHAHGKHGSAHALWGHTGWERCPLRFRRPVGSRADQFDHAGEQRVAHQRE